MHQRFERKLKKLKFVIEKDYFKQEFNYELNECRDILRR